MNVTGLIFETNQIISTNQSYSYPPIISEVAYAEGIQFQQYSFNFNTSITQQQYYAIYQHHFIENCWALNRVVPTYYTFGAMWGTIAIVFIVSLYSTPASERFSLQKSLIMLPTLKCFETLLEGGFLAYCPWYSLTSNGVQYMQMARISIITITYTVFLSFLYLMCKGWQTTISQLSRNQATNLTMIMGGVYLTYSAYFLSVDFNTIYMIMNFVMVLVYGSLGYVYYKNAKENVRLCNSYLTEMQNGEENIMRQSLVIKSGMLR